MIFDTIVKRLLEGFNVAPMPGRKFYTTGPNTQGTTKAILPGEANTEIDGDLLPDLTQLKKAKRVKRVIKRQSRQSPKEK